MTCSRTNRRPFVAGLAAALLAALILVQPVVARAATAESTSPQLPVTTLLDDDGDAVAPGKKRKPVYEPPPPPPRAGWQIQLHERTKKLQLGWIIPAAIFDGGGRAVWWSLGATHGPAVMAVILGVQTIEGCGILASQAELKRIHLWIDSERSALHLARRAEAQGWRWFAVSMASLAAGWIWYGLYTVAWDFGMIISAIMGWLLTFPFLHPAITYWGIASDARRVANGHEFHTPKADAERRKPRPKITSISPMGISIAW